MYSKNSSKLVGIWLLTGVGMIIIQIILGGITRLTGSGLSITEWKPLLGAIPPLTEADWQNAFDKYQQIAQFKVLNAHFTLSDFKFIFFWEWFHRLWGRLLGIVFLIPFIWFWIKGYFNKSMIWWLIILFVLGGLQGLIGWIMVQSGLNDEDLYVSHFRLAIHFMAAMVLLVYTFWFALKLLIQANTSFENRGLKKNAVIIATLLLIQLTYGAFMAGLKAGVFAPSWPTINGVHIPPMDKLNGENISIVSALVNHPLGIHFVHRNLAYLITILLIIWTIKAAREKRDQLFNAIKWWPLVLVIVQVILGIYATLTSYKAVPQVWGVFEWNAQMHQIVAMFLLLSLTIVIFRLRNAARNV